MVLPLIRKLACLTQWSESEQAALQTLAARTHAVAARNDLFSEGTKPTHVDVILEGWACRYKQLANGQRQILAILLPGDLCNSHIDLLPRMDHSIGTLTSVTVARLARPTWQSVMADQPRIRQALEWEMMITAAIQREWTVSLGRRNALEKTAHFFCEIYLRMRSIGLNEGASCPYHLTQTELADALGLTPVHVNRCIQELRGRGLIVLKDRQLTILNLPALQQQARFCAKYLHLDRECQSEID